MPSTSKTNKGLTAGKYIKRDKTPHRLQISSQQNHQPKSRDWVSRILANQADAAKKAGESP